MKNNAFFRSGRFHSLEQTAVVGLTILAAVSCQRSLRNLDEATATPSVAIQPIAMQAESDIHLTVMPPATHLFVQPTATPTASASATVTPERNTATPIAPTETATPTPYATPTLVPFQFGFPTTQPTPNIGWDETDVVVAPQPTTESFGSTSLGNGADFTYTLRDANIGRIETRIIKTEIYTGAYTVIWMSLKSPKDFSTSVCFFPCQISFDGGTFTENIGFLIADGADFRFEAGTDARTPSDPYGRYYNMVFFAEQEVVFGIVFKSERVERLQSVEIPTMQQAIRFTNVYLPYFAEGHFKYRKALQEQAGNSTP